MVAAGVHFTVPLQRPTWGGTFCRFEDPDGNTFVLAGFDDATRAIEAHRKETADRLEAARRAAQELEIAKQVQLRLFPQQKPPMPGLDYAGICVQAKAVGGDYFDFLELSESRLALIVGDISGKGIAAALLMANLQASLRSQHLFPDRDFGELLTSVNRLLFQNTDPAAYATLFLAEFDRTSSRLRYANCGHVPAVLVHRNGAIDRLNPTCSVLGLFADWHCLTAETPFNEGEVLALCTDGITEACNEEGNEFGEAGLVEALQRNLPLPAEDLARSVVEEASHCSGSAQQDDMTLIVAKRLARLST